jgi:hypothetical protein
MMIIWWSKYVGVIFSVLMCDIWINVLLHTSALVGPLHIIITINVFIWRKLQRQIQMILHYLFLGLSSLDFYLFNLLRNYILLQLLRNVNLGGLTTFWLRPAAYRGGGVWWVQTPPPPKFRNFEKVPKIKKILLYEMKFLVPNYSCLQNPCLGGHCLQIPVLSVLNWICWTPPNKIPGYATDCVCLMTWQMFRRSCITNCI